MQGLNHVLRSYTYRYVSICIKVEDEPHFLIKCAFYNSLCEELYTKIKNYCKNFIKLDNKSKFAWLMTTEDIFLVEHLGQSFREQNVYILCDLSKELFLCLSVSTLK
jgi:hypothetical protein